MKRLSVLVALLLTVALVGPAAPADAKPRHPYGFANDQMGVRMESTFPSAEDPHEHVRFTRHDGLGQRQVRIVERQMMPRSPRVYSKVVKLLVGERVAFTTVGAMPCAPEQRPMRVSIQMRVKLPGRDWWPWFTYASEVHYLMPC